MDDSLSLLSSQRRVGSERMKVNKVGIGRHE